MSLLYTVILDLAGIVSGITDRLKLYIKMPSGKSIGKVLTVTTNGLLGWLPTSGGIISDLHQITLGPCRALGYTISDEGPLFSWVDPDNTVLSGTMLALWDSTILLRKLGNLFPIDYTDGTIVASSSILASNKNYYRDHSFKDLTQESGKTYTYKLFSKVKSGAWNNLVANQFTSSTGLSWSQIRDYVKAGRGPELFPVGTVFLVAHEEYKYLDGTGLKFRVVGHDQVPAYDETITHTMCLDLVDCLFSCQYDMPLLLYALTEDTQFVAGKTYYTLEGTTYTACTEGTDYTVGDDIPMVTYYLKNDSSRASYGSNNFLNSNLFQWMNSEGLKNLWFVKKNIFDRCTDSLVGKSGFLKYLDSLFKNVLINAKLVTARHTLDGGGSSTISAKIFPLSRTQLFNNSNNGEVLNVQLSYYDSNLKRIKMIMNSTSACYWWLRSPYVGDSYGVHYVTPSGTLSATATRNSNGACLACIIG